MTHRAAIFIIIIVFSVGVGLSSRPCAAQQVQQESPLQLLTSYTGTKERFAKESPNYPARPDETLRRLDGVMVLVEDLSPDVEEHGLTKSHLMRQVESRLQTANIPLLTNKECFDSPGRPYPYLDVNTHNTGIGIYGYSIRLEFNQETLLARDRSVETSATTWTMGSIGVVGARHLPALAEEAISLVDEFIAAYRAANAD